MEQEGITDEKYRPILKLKYNLTSKIIDGIGLLILISFWYFIITNYKNLPAQIPIHFDASGHADRHGDKIFFILIPTIASILFIVISIFSRFPEKLNYPIKLHEDNVLQQYKNATQMLRIIKVILVTVFTLITYQTVIIVKGDSNGLGPWLALVIFILIFTPVLYFTIRAYRLR